MRKLVLGLLVGAAALAPVIAQAQRVERSAEQEVEPPARVRHAERAARENRAERPERREAREERRAERRERRADPDIERPRPDRDGTRRERRFDGDGVRAARPDRLVERPADQTFPSRRERAERRADRVERREDRRDRPERRAERRDDRGGSDWGRNAYGGGLVWNRGWRDDRRYDWSGGRDRDRGRYRLPRYYAPGGYGHQYRRFGVGVGLTRSLYAESYWIDDPYHYRLPPAYGPYRWVRYYGDALLVDLRTGRVVDLVYDIFT